MTILLIIGVLFIVLLTGMLIAFIFSRLDRTVVNTRTAMAAEERAYSPGVTLGHKIKVESNYDEQMKQARLAAAKVAAATPRGANNRVGRDGQSTLATAGKSVATDPVTAVRIARFHGWDGTRTGIPAGGAVVAGMAPAAVAPRATAATAPAIAAPVLIAITPDMAPEEVRKARIANSKSEAAYNKALKAATSGAPVAVSGAAPVTAAAMAAPAPAVSSIAPPTLIAITPDMAPEDVRKARVANAKAEAAYNKALKAAGGTPGATPQAAAPSVAAPVAAAPMAAAPIPAGIAPPQLIEITDSMSPEDIRRARVANAKAESAYNKALKAAGIDPAAAKSGAALPPPAAPEAPPVAVPVMESVAAPAAAGGATGSKIPAGITLPHLIEITDSMSPEEIRRARVENAKASAAYNKALKAAGIDPASVK